MGQFEIGIVGTGFMHDLAARLAHRVQLTTDGRNPSLTAVAGAFGNQIDYAQLVKIYGEGPKSITNIISLIDSCLNAPRSSPRASSERT